MKVASMTLTARKLAYDLHEAMFFCKNSKRATRDLAKKTATRKSRHEKGRHILMELAA